MTAALRCPTCDQPGVQVRDSRVVQGAVRRRRLCPFCGFRFTTYETVQRPFSLSHENLERMKRRMGEVLALVELELTGRDP